MMGESVGGIAAHSQFLPVGNRILSLLLRWKSRILVAAGIGFPAPRLIPNGSVFSDLRDVLDGREHRSRHVLLCYDCSYRIHVVHEILTR